VKSERKYPAVIFAGSSRTHRADNPEYFDNFTA